MNTFFCQFFLINQGILDSNFVCIQTLQCCLKTLVLFVFCWVQIRILLLGNELRNKICYLHNFQKCIARGNHVLFFLSSEGTEISRFVENDNNIYIKENQNFYVFLFVWGQKFTNLFRVVWLFYWKNACVRILLN